MEQRTLKVKQSVTEQIAGIALFIESKGLLKSAEKFADDVYDFFDALVNLKRSFAVCRYPEWKAIGYKCIGFKKRYTIAFVETEEEIIICEFVPSKLVHW